MASIRRRPGARAASPPLATAAAGAPPLRYRAFLSYCHRDGSVTARLHKRLETYGVPRAVRGTQPDGRVVPARIHPVFRDRDELATAARLSHSIESALDDSEALVVVCSPAAVASPWVNAEIAYFRRCHPGRPVLAFVVGGDPGVDPRRDPAHAAFPPSLILTDPDHPDAGTGEPIAADAREEGDGFAAAFLKLAAGLLGVRYDELRRRDQRRRQLRWMLASASGVVLSAVFAFLAWQATVARDAARAAQGVAELELQSERQTRDFLLSVFHLADANEARGESVTVREVLDRAVARIDQTKFSRPVIRARFLATMGQAYSSLGLNRRGTELLQQSIVSLDGQRLDQETRDQRIDSGIELADMRFDMGDYEAAVRELDAVAPAGEGTVLSPLQRARIANVRGDLLSYQEKDAEAEHQYRAALAELERVGATLPEAESSALRARSLTGLATLALFAGDGARAEKGFSEVFGMLERAHGLKHPRTISALISVGSAAYRNGNRERARQSWQRALEVAVDVFDADTPMIGTTKSNLGVLLLEEGNLDAAEPLLRDALASDRKHRGEDFDDLAYPLHNLGYLLLARGQQAEAATLLGEALPIAERHGHRMLGPILNALADLQCTQGEAEAGGALAERAVAATKGAETADAWRNAQARITLAYCRKRQGASVRSAEVDGALAQIRSRWPRQNPFRVRAEAQFAALR